MIRPRISSARISLAEIFVTNHQNDGKKGFTNHQNNGLMKTDYEFGDEIMNETRFITPEYITADEIKAIRRKLSVTQKEFATLINSSKPTVERWERSKEGITGPICLLIRMLEKYPEYVEKLKVPEKEWPLRLWYMYKQNVCTLIEVDEVKRKVRIKNYTDNLLFRAFGADEEPDYISYQYFLESRCFPESRDKLKWVLRDLDIPFYEPLMIIEKTEGRMAEDDFWIKIER